MDDRTRDIIDYTGIVVGLAMMGLAVVGELLGWWADGGILLGVAGMGVSLVSVYDINGRRLVYAFGAFAPALVSKQDAMLSKQDIMLSKQDLMLTKQDDMLVAEQRATRGLLERAVAILDERLPTAR